ncbi:MAG: acyl-CoA/acyl-ACP dehydrogenase [Candidatus Dormibacteraeota bacterium]|nr:acyl-CoA/acyl-ACP dehydrogenase [Candidatus Dormibacteraeota bacterium]
MDFAFSEEQEMLRSSARTLLAKASPSAVVRKLMETEDAYDADLWKKVAEQGWTALGIPEEYGGFGSFLDLVVVLEETGRVLLPGPFFETMGMAVPALLEAGTEAQKKEALTAIAAGEARATLAFTEPSGRWDADGVTLSAKKSGDGWTLNGTKLFVPGAGVADYIVVAARTRGGGEDGITLFLVKGRPAGMSVKPLSTLDMTHKWYEVKFENVHLAAEALMGEADKGWAPLRRSLDWATAGICAEMVGGAQKVLEDSVEYAKTRQQFGKPIGIYQAVSHKLADMLLEVESAKSVTYYAAWTVDADAPDRALACSIAKAYTSDAYRHATGSGIQVHGGIGFTWEHDMHLYFKRAKASEVTLGDPTYHRELVAEALDL